MKSKIHLKLLIHINSMQIKIENFLHELILNEKNKIKIKTSTQKKNRLKQKRNREFVSFHVAFHSVK